MGTGLVASFLLLGESTWQGSTQTHTLMESLAVLLAFTVGTMALLRYYSRRNNTFLILGVGFVGTGFLDAYNAAITSDWLANRLPYESDTLITWSWTTSRLFLGIFLLSSWVVGWQERRSQTPRRLNERALYLASAGIIVISFLFLSLIPLPRAYQPDLLVHRPEEFVPAIFFLLALSGYLIKGEWRHKFFDHWLVLALIIGLGIQVLFMPWSRQSFDVHFMAAHLLKIASYLCVLVGLLINMFVVFRNIDREIQERKLAEQALRVSQERFDLAVRGSRDGIWDWDIVADEVYLSSRFKDLLGYQDHELQGTFDGWASRLHPDDREATLSALNAHLDDRVPFRAEHRLRCKSGEYRWFLARGQAIWNTAGDAVRMAGSMTDITYRKVAEARIQRLAYFDELTGLPNRRLLVDRLAREMSSARRHELHGALLFLVLDKFKSINVSLGHAVGDKLLQEVANRLSVQVRFEDTVGRLAGDEFVVLLPALSEDAETAIAQSQTVADKIRASLAKPYALQGDSHRVTSSIGVVLFPGTADTADELLQMADSAMYASKKAGRNAIRFYQPDVHSEANSSMIS